MSPSESAAAPTRALPPRYANKLIEAVVSGASPLLGQSIREAGFRARYGAVVIGVHRNGQRIGGRLGDIRLRQGDTLLLEAPSDFAEAFKDSNDFHLVSELPGSAALRHHLAPVATAILVTMVAAITMAPTQAVTFALIAALAMILTRCCTGPQARASVDWQVLLIIGSAFGLGNAMETTGLASIIAGGLVGWAAPLGLWALLAMIYLITAVFTSVITNNAAAVLIFPVALEAARSNSLPLMPFVIILAIAASAGAGAAQNVHPSLRPRECLEDRKRSVARAIVRCKDVDRGVGLDSQAFELARKMVRAIERCQQNNNSVAHRSHVRNELA